MKKTNHQSKKITEKLNIDNSVENCNGERSQRWFFKLDIGRISKKILDKRNKIIILNTNANQWKNTNSVIYWFKQLQYKNRL